MVKKSKSIYLDMQHSIKVINRRYKVEKHLELCLLNSICNSYLNDESVRVLDLLLLEGIASQATLHSGIKSLAKKGLLSMSKDPDDGRIRLVLPTKLALKRLNECEAAIMKCGK
jgi:hypothetical protein